MSSEPMMPEQIGRAGRAPRPLARHVGAPWPAAGASTPTTPTRAERRSPSGCSSWRAVQPGDRVLELACGPGGLGLAAAERVGPGGEVVLSDVAAEMTAIAAARAGALGAGQRRAPASSTSSDIDEPDALLRRRPLPRGAHVRARARPRAARDPPRPAPGGRVARRRVGPARAQPVARARHGRGQRAARRAGAAARDPRPVRARRRRRLRAPARRRGAGRRRRSASSDAAAAPPPSRSGGGAPRRWPARCRRSSRRCRAGLQALRERAREAARPYETASGGLDFPGVTLIAAGRRA